EAVAVPVDYGADRVAPVRLLLAELQKPLEAGPAVDLAAGDGRVLELADHLHVLAGAGAARPVLLLGDAGLLVAGGGAVVGGGACRARMAVRHGNPPLQGCDGTGAGTGRAVAGPHSILYG